jgi:hypothetical protein
MAKLHKDINYIGIEMYDSVMVKAIEKLKNEEKLNNLKLILLDAQKIDEVFDKEIDRIYLNFSDPWPKAKHAKRRLTSKVFLEKYDNIFKNKKEIFQKTDNNDLFEFSMLSFEEAGYKLENVTRDLSTDDQHIINDAIDSLENATENLIEAADTTAYEDAVKDAEEIIAEGNSQGRYDEEDWNKFIESVTNAKDTVGSNIGNIPKTEQDKVNTATDTINNATEEIYNKRYIFVSFKGESGEVYRICKVYSDGRTFGDLTDMPELPEGDDFKKYIGWYYANNTTMKLTDAITEDIDVFCYAEEIKLVSLSFKVIAITKTSLSDKLK